MNEIRSFRSWIPGTNNEFRYSFISFLDRNEFRSFVIRSWAQERITNGTNFVIRYWAQERMTNFVIRSFRSWARNEFRSFAIRSWAQERITNGTNFVIRSWAQERMTNFVIRSFRSWTGTNFVHSLFVPGLGTNNEWNEYRSIYHCVPGPGTE